MEIKGLKLKEESYNGNKYFALYVVIDKSEYLIGTLKEIKSTGFKYIKTITRKER